MERKSIEREEKDALNRVSVCSVNKERGDKGRKG